MPHKDRIAQQTEALVLKYNPDWKSAGYKGTMPPMFAWARDHFDLRTFHVVQAPLEFTREDWCGCIRACRGVGASLSTAEVERFDAEHHRLLEAIAPDTFTVLHHMTLHVFVRKGTLTTV